MGKQPGNNRVAIAQLLPCLQKSRGTQKKEAGIIGISSKKQTEQSRVYRCDFK